MLFTPSKIRVNLSDLKVKDPALLQRPEITALIPTAGNPMVFIFPDDADRRGKLTALKLVDVGPSLADDKLNLCTKEAGKIIYGIGI